jgi:hypothetical protein
MRNAFSRGVLLLILVATLGGCGIRTSGGTAPDPPTPLRVQNLSPLDMRIYLVLAEGRHRLGLANANATTTLRIPAHLIGIGREVSFIADPVGRRGEARSFSIFVRPGEQVGITIPGRLR